MSQTSVTPISKNTLLTPGPRGQRSAPPPRKLGTGPRAQRSPYDERDDASLALDAAKGDPQAHAAIWERYAPLVRRMLVRAIGPSDDVDDQVQEVFLRFYCNRTSLRDPAALRGFLLGITFYTASAELRSRRTRRWMLLTRHGALDQYRAPDPNHEARMAVPRLSAILDQLDKKSRLGFVLHYVEGRRLAEVASALEVSLATVKRQLSRTSKCVLASARADLALASFVR